MDTIRASTLGLRLGLSSPLGRIETTPKGCIETMPLPAIIRQGRTLTANIQTQRGPTVFSGLEGDLSGLTEFWQCVKNTPPARVNECLQHLISRDGKEIEIDIFKQKIPLKFELKPDWVWFAAGFLTAWILKR